MKKAIVLAMALAAAFLAPGCTNYTPQVSLPAYIQKVAVPVFSNKTPAYGMEQYVTQKTIDLFISDGKLSIADEMNSDAIVKVSLEKYMLAVTNYDVNQIPQQYRLRIYFDIYFFDNKNQRQIWEEKELWEETTYYVVNNLGMPAETEEAARNRVLDRIADRVFRRVVYGW
ncbi:MAG: LPS assembly lipoprotein LptE [Spirochaetia bacterium]|nr:LPS assembly lipoprotein LptE [Spirochaetia bacterium]